jgi:hypothetical protein
VIALGLASLCFLGLLALHLPSARKWPEHCGVQGDDVANGFFEQLLFPFTWKNRA